MDPRVRKDDEIVIDLRSCPEILESTPSAFSLSLRPNHFVVYPDVIG